MSILKNAFRGSRVGRLVDMPAEITLERLGWKGKANPLLNRLATAATIVGMAAATLLLMAALTGVTLATVRYVSERIYRTLWQIENAAPHIAPR